MGISSRTVKRMLAVNPEHMCVDGTQTRKSYRLLDPYRKEIAELLEQGFQTSQILIKLQERHPDIPIKRTTLSDFCVNLREELFKVTPSSTETPPSLSDESILSPYMDKINSLLSEGKQIIVIYATIQSDGYIGSYSLLQQICARLKPRINRTKKATRKVRRKDLVSATWSGKSGLPKQNMELIQDKFPVMVEIQDIISTFRTAYSDKDIESIRLWCERFAQCQFPAIRSFIRGIDLDSSAFYNSMRFSYSNALLEGCVNKLKAVKRSMYGRASYALLRAKLLLSNKT